MSIPVNGASVGNNVMDIYTFKKALAANVSQAKSIIDTVSEVSDSIRARSGVDTYL